MTAELAFAGISKRFDAPEGSVLALDGLSFEVPAGRFVALLGPSGSGKSTLLEIAAGLREASSGQVLLDGRPASAAERLARLGYMPQRDLLLPWRRLIDNLILGPELAGSQREAAREQARALLPAFGLEGFERAWPRQLSGGMRQRAALLRTVLAGRQSLLLDEPFGALDALTRMQLQAWLQLRWREQGWTVLLVTHDVDEAVYLADEVLVLSPRPGGLVAKVEVPLERPRLPAMRAAPEYGACAAALLGHLGVA